MRSYRKENSGLHQDIVHSYSPNLCQEQPSKLEVYVTENGNMHTTQHDHQITKLLR
jgi:hypothetical protein